VFSRGRTPASLPANVETLIGDRNSDLDSIKNRDWDAVIDVATFGPGWVRSLGEALKGRVKHYTFISTVSVYDNPANNTETTEDSAVLAWHGDVDPFTITTEGEYYGAAKVLCEQEARKQFPRTLILRPGSIGGPDDTHPRRGGPGHAGSVH
jgi:2'-hydroxyisoflavone reductase